MDNLKPQIPINTRTIGTPEQISIGNNNYILYIEDYVHTFIQKNLEHIKNVMKVSLFGQRIDDNGMVNLVISGASFSREDSVFFPQCIYLGTATICQTSDNILHIELYAQGVVNIIEDYYIYYDQNEEMQNFLISYNMKKSEPTKARNERSKDVARYGKILQAYNKEDAKVSFMWNVMTLLCLSFVVCIVAYGIISINNYSKMQSIQSGIDYCMKILDEQLLINAESQSEDILAEAEDIEIETEENIVISEEINEEITTEETLQVSNTNVPQYYIVQKGDTLRKICYEVYGDYDYVEKVCLWNEIDDPNNILCGQRLIIY